MPPNDNPRVKVTNVITASFNPFSREKKVGMKESKSYRAFFQVIRDSEKSLGRQLGQERLAQLLFQTVEHLKI